MKKLFLILAAAAVVGLLVGCGGKKEEAAKEETMEQAQKPAATTMVKDVVCGMEVDTTQTVVKASYEGKTYYFCSDECKQKFEANPSEYVMHEEKEQEKEGEK